MGISWRNLGHAVIGLIVLGIVFGAAMILLGNYFMSWTENPSANALVAGLFAALAASALLSGMMLAAFIETWIPKESTLIGCLYALYSTILIASRWIIQGNFPNITGLPFRFILPTFFAGALISVFAWVGTVITARSKSNR